MLEEIHLLDNENTTISSTYNKTYNRVYEADSMRIIYPRAQDLITSNRFDPLDDEKNQEHSSLSMDSKLVDNEACRKYYNSNNNLVGGYHNQIPRTQSGCLNKNVYVSDYPLCFNKPPIYNKSLNNNHNNNYVKIKKPNQNKMPNLNPVSTHKVGNNKIKLDNGNYSDRTSLDKNLTSFPSPDIRSGINDFYPTVYSDLNRNPKLGQYGKPEVKPPIINNQSTGAIPKVTKNIKAKGITNKTYAKVTASKAVNTIPIINKSNDNKVITPVQAQVSITFNKQLQQINSGAVVPVEVVTPAKRAAAEASTTAINTLPSQDIFINTVTKGDPTFCTKTKGVTLKYGTMVDALTAATVVPKQDKILKKKL